MSPVSSAHRRAFVRFATLAVLVALVPLSGCEEAVGTPPDLDAAYTLWGAFDPTADSQSVRVIPITRTIGGSRPDPLDVVVTSVDLATGAETAWRDSVIAFDDGTFGHVYFADLRPAFESRHVFRVVDADGETSALVSVPPLVEPRRRPAELGVTTSYPTIWTGAPQLNRVRAAFDVVNNLCGRRTSVMDVPPVRAQPVEFGWQVVLPFSEMAHNLLAEEIRLYPPELGQRRALSVEKITLMAEVASEDWRPPGGVFDREVLVEPSLLTNVRRGFGLVGAAYPVSLSWVPTPNEVARTELVVDACGN